MHVRGRARSTTQMPDGVDRASVARQSSLFMYTMMKADESSIFFAMFQQRIIGLRHTWLIMMPALALTTAEFRGYKGVLRLDRFWRN